MLLSQDDVDSQRAMREQANKKCRELSGALYQATLRLDQLHKVAVEAKKKCTEHPSPSWRQAYALASKNFSATWTIIRKLIRNLETWFSGYWGDISDHRCATSDLLKFHTVPSPRNASDQTLRNNVLSRLQYLAELDLHFAASAPIVNVRFLHERLQIVIRESDPVHRPLETYDQWRYWLSDVVITLRKMQTDADAAKSRIKTKPMRNQRATRHEHKLHARRMQRISAC